MKRATLGFGYLGIPGVPGNARDPAHANWIEITGAGPPAMLPATLGHGTLVSLQITKVPDVSSAVLKDVLHLPTLPCAFLALGPSKDYLFASYALGDARISSFELIEQPVSHLQTEKLTVSFARASWQYQLRSADGSPMGAVINGQGVSGKSSGRFGGGKGPLIGGLLGVAVFLAGAIFFVRGPRRRRARMELNPTQPPSDAVLAGINPQAPPPSEPHS